MDFLNGGEGDDLLEASSGDMLSGGEGSDLFLVGDWLEDGDAARILDFNAEEDGIEVVYDATAHPDPVLTLNPIEGSDDVEIHLDGLPLAMVQNGSGLDISAIRLTAAA